MSMQPINREHNQLQLINNQLLGAAKAGDKDTVTSLLDQSPDVNCADENGYTALIWAAANGRQDIWCTCQSS